MHINPMGIYELSSTELLHQAYDAICLKRINQSPNGLIRDVRFKWGYLLPLFQSDTYSRCRHQKGGIHQAVQEVKANIHDYQYVFKSDNHGYYESIQHDILLAEFRKVIQCEGLIKLFEQYLKSVYYPFLQGIPKGCLWSPVMGALMLKPLHDALSQKGFYCQFMDDWVILVKTKSQLQRVIKITHRVSKQLKLKMHPDKTMISRISRGFNFLGIYFGRVIQIAKQSIENHRLRISRRYAQGIGKNDIDLSLFKDGANDVEVYYHP